jgi:DNA-binding Lrp family transcriptional regulator
MVLACIMIHCKPGTARDVSRIISEIKGIKRVFETLGAYDVVAEYEFTSLEKLGIAVYEIARISGVISTETLIETLM